MEFSWPWEYSFPPFFTIQPNVETQKKQLEAWRRLIIDYCQHHKIYILDLQEAQSSPLFKNKEIDRELSTQAIDVIMNSMKDHKLIEWCDKNKKRCNVYWRTSEEWASLIYRYIVNNAMTNTVCTFFELVSSEEVENEAFAGLDESMLIKALKVLEAEKKAELVITETSQGVKFF